MRQVWQSCFEIVVWLMTKCEVLNCSEILEAWPDRFVWCSEHFNDQIDLVDFTRARQQRSMDEKFAENAADSPHVYNKIDL